jgi:hypothetical protein
MSIIDKIKVLEKKAASFDDAMIRISKLQAFCDDFIKRGGKAAKIRPVMRLIDFYYTSFPHVIEKALEDGYFESVPKKYTGSHFLGDKITKVRVYPDGQVYLFLDNDDEVPTFGGFVSVLESPTEYPADRALTSIPFCQVA